MNPAIPFDKIVQFGQASQLYTDLFCVSWLLGRYCNYSCSYCWPFASSNLKDHRSTEQIVSVMDEIKRQARTRGFNSFHFSFSGGEATLHKGLLDIVTHYSKDAECANYQSLHLTTNLSPGVAWWKKYVEVAKGVSRLGITASFHHEFANQDEFLKKMLYLKMSGVIATINIVMLPQKFDDLYAIAQRFYDEGLNVTVKPQSDETANKIVEGYTPEMLRKLQESFPQRNWLENELESLLAKNGVPKDVQLAMTDDDGNVWFMDQAERLNSFHFNRFSGWECSAGYRSIIIREPDGSVKRSYSCTDAPLGHLDTGFQLFDSVQLCKTPRCFSSADSKIPKRKQGCTLPLWTTTGA